MWALIESEQRCCLDLPDIRAVTPDWMDNGTYLGIDEVQGHKCYHWQKVNFHRKFYFLTIFLLISCISHIFLIFLY